ncbi:hypothetical protein CMP1-24 [Clavibacter phage CMP1]|uniref:Uncharacterized protein n=1 Tax=Clavibacter phage CMP1 TaxID=686439 RepID=D0U208_9CAUD|nr:hypothetical protein CMP1-24 [Clavibacter phage CMP1]ACY35920.1 hypothetical protein CMP1-24 [Clavibacter phage CMP1]
MAHAGWKGGDGRKFERDTSAWRDRLLLKADRAIEIAVEAGDAALVDNLEAAITPTGIRREETSGGRPGRHESGTMVNSVTNSGADVEVTSNIRIGYFGWAPEDYKLYFKEQDLGTAIIPAAGAMAAARSLAIDRFNQEMKRFTK